MLCVLVVGSDYSFQKISNHREKNTRHQANRDHGLSTQHHAAPKPTTLVYSVVHRRAQLIAASPHTRAKLRPVAFAAPPDLFETTSSVLCCTASHKCQASVRCASPPDLPVDTASELSIMSSQTSASSRLVHSTGTPTASVCSPALQSRAKRLALSVVPLEMAETSRAHVCRTLCRSA
ncbi:hypothetical protein PI124_g19802 [Phytophthora idaei]|nr:hypothetical protein PI125_g20914 [Phytophthora idaei]KAG3131191.1 hypothetical protein PI126_g20175 [Phytophthora idaei]KAG3235158.1 hypothetical protein PI124_g19802 [Phytophthora idaei]